MNKNTIIALSIIILAGVGIIWYIDATDNQSSTSTTSSINQPVTTTDIQSGTDSPVTFNNIFSQSGNHECTYQQVSPSMRIMNVIYLSGGQMRGEFRSTINGVMSANLIIYNDGYLYQWQEGASVGTKSSIKTLADVPLIIPSDLNSGEIYGNSSDNDSWDCYDWLKDPSLLTVPTNVTFTATS